jgi:hypothetical protein
MDAVATDTVAIVGLVAAVGSSVGAIWAAREARKAAAATKDAVEATLGSAFIDEYFKPEMAQALRTLSQWKRDTGSNFAAIWITGRSRGDDECVKVDLARRHVKGYFIKTSRLYESGLIRESTLRLIAYVAGLNVFLDEVDALDKSLNPDYCEGELLRQVLGEFREAKRILPINFVRP